MQEREAHADTEERMRRLSAAHSALRTQSSVLRAQLVEAAEQSFGGMHSCVVRRQTDRSNPAITRPLRPSAVPVVPHRSGGLGVLQDKASKLDSGGSPHDAQHGSSASADRTPFILKSSCSFAPALPSSAGSFRSTPSQVSPPRPHLHRDSAPTSAAGLGARICTGTRLA